MTSTWNPDQYDRFRAERQQPFFDLMTLVQPRPAMRVVQALHWMQDVLAQEDERARVSTTLRRLFADPDHGCAIRDDLRAGLSALPIWMQEFLRGLLDATDGDGVFLMHRVGALHGADHGAGIVAFCI